MAKAQDHNANAPSYATETEAGQAKPAATAVVHALADQLVRIQQQLVRVQQVTNNMLSLHTMAITLHITARAKLISP
jgi:hypothetical protein